MKRVLLLSPILLAACQSNTTTVATLVGEPTGATTTQLIGASGGTVTSPNGDLTIQVPAGAVSADVALSATPITSKATRAVGQAWRLGPEGTTFTKAVTISFKYTDSMLNGAAPELILVAFQNSDRTWTSSAPTLDKALKTVSFESKHLSDWSMVLSADGSTTTKLRIRGSYQGTITRGHASLEVTDGVSFSVVFPLKLGVYGEPPAGVTANGPIGQEFNLQEDEASVTSATDNRDGCPKPTLHGPLELMTVKEITTSADEVTIVAKYSFPAVDEGIGMSQCVSGTEVVAGEEGTMTYRLNLSSAEWKMACTQTVSFDADDWHWSVGP